MKLPSPKALGVLAGSCLAAGIMTAVYASRVETRRYRRERLSIACGAAVGEAGSRTREFKILHLSDLHLCYPESHKVDFLQRITDEDYDLVFLTGDVFENYSGLAYASKILSRLPRIGAFAVLGNHDYYDYTMLNKTIGRILRRHRHPRAYRDVGPMVQSLESAGFQVLRNNAVSLPVHGLHIVGVDYPGIHPSSLIELATQDDPDSLVVALFHVPRDLASFQSAGVHLACGGHTHGGQIRLPGFGALVTDSELPRKEASGLVFRGNTVFHISRGLGADPRTNFRLFCPPAATVLEVTFTPTGQSARGD